MPRATTTTYHGKLCKACGTTERYKSGHCVHCTKARDKQRLKDNPQHNIEKSHKWRRDPRRQLLSSAKARAKARGVPFLITLEDIVFPKNGLCPYLGVRLMRNGQKFGPNSPTLDSIIPSLGYTPGNVLVVSHRANTIKNNATWQELVAIGLKLKELTK
jgi:hypothetical protein